MKLISNTSNEYLIITKINKTSFTYDIVSVDEDNNHKVIEKDKRKKIKVDSDNNIYLQTSRDKDRYFLTNKDIIEYRKY